MNENGVILIFWLDVKKREKTSKKACFLAIARDRRIAPPNPAGGAFVWLV
jgi:hypothetical protein